MADKPAEKPEEAPPTTPIPEKSPAAPVPVPKTPAGSGNKNPEIWKAAAMADHYDKVQRLPELMPGVPNFRRVPGYKVYCCGQPTKDGFENVIKKVCGEKYLPTSPIIWINMRQEPVIYVNGDPICARPPNKIGEYAELGNVTRNPHCIRTVDIGWCAPRTGQVCAGAY
jgi:hypothetical protein